MNMYFLFPELSQQWFIQSKLFKNINCLTHSKLYLTLNIKGLCDEKVGAPLFQDMLVQSACDSVTLPHVLHGDCGVQDSLQHLQGQARPCLLPGACASAYDRPFPARRTGTPWSRAAPGPPRAACPFWPQGDDGIGVEVPGRFGAYGGHVPRCAAKLIKLTLNQRFPNFFVWGWMGGNPFSKMILNSNPQL